MASLYKSVSQTRKILIVILVFFGLILLWSIYQNARTRDPVTATPEETRFFMRADRIFGEVPAPLIDGIDYNDNATFSIESVNPTFPDVSYVYKIEQPRETLLSVQNAERTAQALGFEPRGYTTPDAVTLRWTKDNNTKTLEYNKVTRKWDLTTKYRENEIAIARKSMFDSLDRYIAQGVSMISSLGFNTLGLGSPLVEGKLATFGVDGVFVDVGNIAGAEYVHLNIYRRLPLADLKPTNERPVGQAPQVPSPIRVYSDDPRYGQFHSVVSNQLRNYGNDVFEVDFTDYEYSTLEKGSYLITTPEEAWDNIQRGMGSLVYIKTNDSNYFANFDTIEVSSFKADGRQTELAFFEPEEWSGFVTPIYVFKGQAILQDGNVASFVFYMDAIKRIT